MADRPRKPMNQPGANDTVDVEADVRAALHRAASGDDIAKEKAPDPKAQQPSKSKQPKG